MSGLRRAAIMGAAAGMGACVLLFLGIGFLAQALIGPVVGAVIAGGLYVLRNSPHHPTTNE